MDWSGLSILITGGTGSFGRAFTKVLLEEFHPRRVIIFSRDELKQHEMRRVFPEGGNMRYFLGDVRDKERLVRAMHGVDIVVHAAALKHVPACEYNPLEAVKTNILGAKNVIDAAIDAGVKKVLALSTDKAVNPVNLYGATKLVAEKIFVQGNAYTGGIGTIFSCVRYGNVVASRGSVVPLFLEQQTTGTLTITDRRMTRFWLTLDQAVRLVLRSLVEMRGGEIFVPKIPSMRIVDLAAAIAPECELNVTGIRPGEKIHEVLLSEDEARHTIETPDLYVIQPEQPFWTHEHTVGKGPPDGFRYASDTNAEWVTVEQMRALLAPSVTPGAKGAPARRARVPA
jgi:UDP-N-acetylglucosamine 4,6-dehydratase